MMTSLLVCLAVTLQADQPQASTYRRPVKVVLKNGREVRGLIDQESGRKSLWVRIERGNVRLTIEYAWKDVRHVVFGKSAKLTGVELRRHVHRYRSKGRRLTGPEPWQKGALRRQQQNGQPQQVRSLQVEATLANWDRDEEPDGFLITVIPRNANGEVIRTNGQLQVKLIGQRVDTAVFPNPLVQLEQWGARITSQTTVVRLPFRRIRPESDLTLSSLGKLVVRLNVPGTGSFDATVETRIRRFRFQSQP